MQQFASRPSRAVVADAARIARRPPATALRSADRDGAHLDLSAIPLRAATPSPTPTIGPSNDAFETAADKAAERVMAWREPVAKAAGEQSRSLRESAPVPRLQAKTSDTGARSETAAPAIVRDVLNTPGQPLDGATRAFMEPRFGQDFSQVRVHADTKAAASAAAISARAYTLGSHIAFAAGRYDPATASGRHLLSHELAHVVQQGGARISPSVIRRFAGDAKEHKPPPGGQKDASFRFGGDKALQDITDGKATLKKGDKSAAVTKLQQALVDMGYALPSGMTGEFNAETETALKKFQTDAGIAPQTGEFDAATIKAMDAKYDTRQPYLDNATFDPAAPDKGLRDLSAADSAAATQSLVPQRGLGGTASTFQQTLPGKKNYGPRIKRELAHIIRKFHKELFEDKKPLRKKPAKNFHAWSTLEQTAQASKDVTDKVYGSYASGPAMTAAGGNFVDQWEDELTRNAAMSGPDLKDKAEGKVWYLIASNCADINQEHSAVPTDAAEKAILTPIVASFVDTKAKVQTLLDLETGWEGAQLQGTVYLQRYKNKKDSDNRKQLWDLFHTCIHEYIHTLGNPNFKKYARDFRTAGDPVRYNTLIEGFCDFFTENVRKTVKVTDALRQQIEGTYYDKNEPVPSVDPDTYPSRAQAEQMISIVGIRNAEAAYFKGDVKRIGGP